MLNVNLMSSGSCLFSEKIFLPIFLQATFTFRVSNESQQVKFESSVKQNTFSKVLLKIY